MTALLHLALLYSAKSRLFGSTLYTAVDEDAAQIVSINVPEHYAAE